mmetsp:Transcript_26791/g.55354  ORF Transcript_26791/g.55354 Transcript_26791/m.55354 type:complete len:608 (-) Transcript_26791:267-2090(-)|eukprot:CAMPEP_0201135466 /NCGR_PEP_ID=MMETSP0850-20130426/54329_1 /ASSEMBLY_ACC=CAM_ASM_000622 /TAXON_ID=183588 /ORGANISM="Pseudo-nitzschia fraudulenta, Strain WWA7" /LENGTH=607 /DNA_ID=CAMNT_0047406631 /DNA_START=90 /DNA_END=1913 /DNA_ORIENTATION=+
MAIDNNEITRLFVTDKSATTTTKAGHGTGIGGNNHFDNASYPPPQKKKTNNPLVGQRIVGFWKTLGMIFTALLLTGFFLGTKTKDESSVSSSSSSSSLRSYHQQQLLRAKKVCRFCNEQSPPVLHHDKSYTIELDDHDNANNATVEVVVTPMTITYDYELFDGEMVLTPEQTELLPNLEFDYAVLAIEGVRNLDRDRDLADVSLDEVYVHHLTLFPVNMIGAEVLSRTSSDPYLSFPKGYGVHVRLDETPFLRTNAHLISNKNLRPIDGSAARAHKECNECYYAPGKGSECTPEQSGTFFCCGDSVSCIAGETCACATTTVASPLSGVGQKQQKLRQEQTKTRYRIEMNLLVSREIDRFVRVDQWNLAAPACSVNILGDGVFHDYPVDSYCREEKMNREYLASHHLGGKYVDDSSGSSSSEYVSSTLLFGGGSVFHSVPEIESDSDPYYATRVHVLAPSGGTILWAQSHLHTGGVSATLSKNGEVLCGTKASYGTDPDPSTNARNEQNHLVGISSCYDTVPQSGEGIRFELGDVFVTESVYYGRNDDPNLQGNLGAAGEHKNVMSMFFLGVVFDGDSEFMTKNRTSFNLWNDFVNVAGYHGNHPGRQ